MGGPGAGHKSERARRARLVNMAKARAARKRVPRPWRSGLESRVIEQLVWQWWLESSGQWLVASGERNPRPAYARVKGLTPTRRGELHGGAMAGRPSYAQNASAGKPWARLRVAGLLGVSHTWVNKLVKRFEADPERMRRRMAAFAPATMEKLERAREETRRQRELGWLRGPIRMRRVAWTLGGRKQRALVWTHAERRRREAARATPRPQTEHGAPSKPTNAELPAWARGAVKL